ncbi:hypothetical protein ACFHVG_27985, partial [Micromonospora sp. LOL_027]
CGHRWCSSQVSMSPSNPVRDIVLAMEGLGALLGALAAGSLARTVGSARAIILATAGSAALSLLMPLSARIAESGIGGHRIASTVAGAILCLGLGCLAMGLAVLAVLTRSHRQIVCPPELLGRVVASVRFVSWTAIPLGAVLAGAAAQKWQPSTGLVCACLGAIVVPLLLWSSRVRQLRDLEDGDSFATGQAGVGNR